MNWRCRGADGSVRAITSARSDIDALDENHFSPLSTQSSPSCTASVRMPVASAPAARSVIEKQIRRSPLISGTRYLVFWASVPCSSQRHHGGVLRSHAVHPPRAEVVRGAGQLDLDDGVAERTEAHATQFDRHQRTPQTERAGDRLQLRHDLEVRPTADLGFGRQRVLVDEARATRARRFWISGGSSKSIIRHPPCALALSEHAYFVRLCQSLEVVDSSEIPPGAWKRRHDLVAADLETVALRLFATAGSRRSRCRTSPRKPAIAPRTFYRYFPTKADVLLAHRRRLFDRLLRALAARPADESPTVALRQAFLATAVVGPADDERVAAIGRLLYDRTGATVELGYEAARADELVAVLGRRQGRPVSLARRVEVTATLAVAELAHRNWLAGDRRTPLPDHMRTAFRALDQIDGRA